MYCIMRSDYSAVLMLDGATVTLKSYSYAYQVAEKHCGHVVKWKVAKKILTINRMIGRKI